MPNCTRYLGKQSTFAPLSMSKKGRLRLGITVANAGRSTPLMRPSRTMPLASSAPVDPAETMAWARPSLTERMAETMEEPGFLRTASMGASSLVITSVVSTNSSRSRGCAIPFCPKSRMRASFHSSSAAIAPSTAAPGALSPPIASSAITISGTIVTSVLRISQNKAQKRKPKKAPRHAVLPALAQILRIALNYSKNFC